MPPEQIERLVEELAPLRKFPADPWLRTSRSKIVYYVIKAELARQRASLALELTDLPSSWQICRRGHDKSAEQLMSDLPSHS